MFLHNYSLTLDDVTMPNTEILNVVADDCDEELANKNNTYTLDGFGSGE